MNPHGRRVVIDHARDCQCVIDGDAIYVRKPCRVIGWHVTKKRVKQLLHALKKSKNSQDD